MLFGQDLGEVVEVFLETFAGEGSQEFGPGRGVDFHDAVDDFSFGHSGARSNLATAVSSFGSGEDNFIYRAAGGKNFSL